MAARFDYERGYKRGIRKLWVALLAVPLVLIIGMGVVAKWYNDALQPLSDTEAEVVVVIEQGATTTDIANLLEDRSVIRSATAFEWYTRLKNNRSLIQAGSYIFSPTESVEDVVARLINGDVSTDLFTILPAQRIDQIRAAFIEAGFPAEIVDQALEPTQYENHPALTAKPIGDSLEGYLYPESYQYTFTSEVSDIVEAALDQTALALTDENRALYAQQGLSVHEAVIFASLVESEVSNPQDRPFVAQVFLRRNQIGMRLGSDSTAIYGAAVNGLELAIFADTPYNTRIYSGLPPGPISNVSKNSLDAVANPSSTNYLYFVSGDDGVTHFAETIAEHEANTAKYCIELCKLF